MPFFFELYKPISLLMGSIRVPNVVIAWFEIIIFYSRTTMYTCIHNYMSYHLA